MADGDYPDDDLPVGQNPLNNVNEIILMQFWPQYVINATIIDGDVRRTLPPIRIPRRYTAFNPGVFVNLVRGALTHISQYPLNGPQDNPLRTMLAWRADYWSVTLNSSGEGVQVGFFPVYINTPPQTSVSESSTDDEQPRLFEPDSSSKAGAGGSSRSSSSTDNEQPGPSNLVNSSSRDSPGESRRSVDQSTGRQVKKRQGVKKQREHGRSESRNRKRRRSDHAADFYSLYIDNSPESHWETHMNRSSSDDEEPEPSNLVNSSIARAGETKEWKWRGSDPWSDSDSNSDSSRDSLRSGFSCSGETSRDNEQPEPSHKNNSEVRTDRSRTHSAQNVSSVSQEMKQGGKRKRKTSGRSESRERKSKQFDRHSGSESNDEQPGPSHKDNSEARASDDQISEDESRLWVSRKRKLFELEGRKSDQQSDFLIDSLISDFFGMYISTPPTACGKMPMKSSNTDDEQDALSQLVSSSEVRAGGSTALSDQSSGSQTETKPGLKRKIKTSDRSESRESKRKRLDHRSGSESNDDQPGPSVRDSNEARAGGSRALSDQSSGSQIETGQCLKRKTSDMAESRESKCKRLDHRSGSESNDEQPGPSHKDNREDRASDDQISQDESRQGVNRKRKLSEFPETQSEMRKSDQQFDFLIDSLISDVSRMYISTPPTACGKMPMKSSNTDDEQNQLSQLVSSSEVRADGSTALSDQSSGSQTETKPGLKRKRKTSDRSESRESKRKRLDHRSGSESNDDQPGPSVRDSNEARAGGSRAPSDPSSSSQIETQQSLKRKRKTSDRSESRESKRKRLDHRFGSESNDDQPGPSVRDNNETRADGSRAPSDQRSSGQIETRQTSKRKRKTSDRSESRERKVSD